MPQSERKNKKSFKYEQKSHSMLDFYIVYGDETHCIHHPIASRFSVATRGKGKLKRKLSIDICKHRVAWTLNTTNSRHQSQAGWWGVYLKTYTSFEIALVQPSERSGAGEGSVVGRQGSRTSRMAGRRRGRSSNVQQQHASPNQRRGPRRVSSLLSIWNVATLCFSYTAQDPVKVNVSVLNVWYCLVKILEIRT